jgi:hypothetical protein
MGAGPPSAFEILTSNQLNFLSLLFSPRRLSPLPVFDSSSGLADRVKLLQGVEVWVSEPGSPKPKVEAFQDWGNYISTLSTNDADHTVGIA